MTAQFPTTLPIGYSVHRKPVTASKVINHASGRSVRRSLYSVPLFQYELTFEGLSSGAARGGIAAASKQALEGFFTDQLGQAGFFLYRDADNNAVTGQVLGTGDGSTTQLTFLWTIGSRSIPVGQVDTGSTINVYLNGSLQSSSGYSIVAPNLISFNSAPGSGVVVTADFSYFFMCAFGEDDMDFEEFMAQLWSVGSVKFMSVKP